MKRHGAGSPGTPGSPIGRPAGVAEELGERYGLSGGAVEQLGLLHNLLATDPRAPTSVRDPGLVLDDHLADALVALELVLVRASTRIVDLGAGAGVPGLPLAIALPTAEVVLVDSNARKRAFMQRAVDVCRVSNASVVCARAEAWAAGRERFDLATARALAHVAVVAEYAAPLLVLGGAVVVWRGRRDLREEEAGVRAAHELGLDASEPLPVEPYAGALNRHLQVMVKTQTTPARFPRRPGAARKRPLGVLGGPASDRRHR